jgi:RNA polymerase sigma factor (sigma-70 family)
VYHLAIDTHRWRRRIASLTSRIQFQAPTVHGAATDVDGLAAVWSAVDALPERQRAIVYLRFRMDFTYDTIATILGITAGAARGQGSVAMATLQRKLRDFDEA